MPLRRTVLLGLLFLTALGVLAYYTLFLTDFTFFAKPAEMTVRFSESHGLREGDSVLVAGMRWGKVKRLTFNKGAENDRRISVTMTLNEPLELREGFAIRIEEATLLGGRNLTIDPGPASGAPVHMDQMLFGTVGKNPLDSLGGVVEESQKGLKEIIENLSQIMSGVRQGHGPAGRLFNDEELAQNIADTAKSAAHSLASIEKISGDLAAGRGTFGQLLASSELHDELLASTKRLKSTIDEMTLAVADVRGGKGLVPRLLNDERLANDFADTLAQVRSIVNKIDHGEGTLPTLLNDSTIAANLTKVTQTVADGQGSLGALLTKSDIYDNLKETTENLAVITAQVKAGQGSLGRLLMDDEIYQQIKTALQVVQRALEEYREAAPVTTFTAVLFGVF
jgi:phospholipid/cholesterol/gamma-HCH transport system substrate-binding protein